MSFPPVRDLLPHGPPMVLLDEVLGSDGATTCCRRTLADGQPLVRDGRARSVLAVELLAQACAVHRALGAGARAPAGMLVGVPLVRLEVDALRAGDVLDVTVTLVDEAGPLRTFAGEVRRGDEVVARGRLQVIEHEEVT